MMGIKLEDPFYPYVSQSVHLDFLVLVVTYMYICIYDCLYSHSNYFLTYNSWSTYKGFACETIK